MSFPIKNGGSFHSFLWTFNRIYRTLKIWRWKKPMVRFGAVWSFRFGRSFPTKRRSRCRSSRHRNPGPGCDVEPPSVCHRKNGSNHNGTRSLNTQHRCESKRSRKRKGGTLKWLIRWAEISYISFCCKSINHDQLIQLTATYHLLSLFGYGSIPIDTFLVGWSSIYQLFWGSLGTRVLTHPHLNWWTLKFQLINDSTCESAPKSPSLSTSAIWYQAWEDGIPQTLKLASNTHRIHGAGIYANMTGVYWW